MSTNAQVFGLRQDRRRILPKTRIGSVTFRNYIMSLGITTKSFVAQIEELVKTKRMPYLDAILHICQEKDIEPERIVRFIDKGMKEKLQMEAEASNALKGPKCNKLPL